MTCNLRAGWVTEEGGGGGGGGWAGWGWGVAVGGEWGADRHAALAFGRNKTHLYRMFLIAGALIFHRDRATKRAEAELKSGLYKCGIRCGSPGP